MSINHSTDSTHFAKAAGFGRAAVRTNRTKATMPAMFAILALLALLLALMFQAPPALAQEAAPPPVSARAAVMINADSGKVLYSLNPDLQLPMASTTKMMTALLTLENCKNLDEWVTTSQRAAEVGESSIWLIAGEKLTVRDLLTGMLIQSGNDAATTLAEYQSGSVEAFAELMNKRAAELGMANTHFANPHGLDADGHYTSAADFARLGRELMKFPLAREIVRLPEANIAWVGQPYPRTLTSKFSDLLAAYPFVNGIKTGYTDNAGQCIVISASQNGVNLIIAYLGGPSLSQRDAEVAALALYGFDNYRPRKVIEKGTTYTSLDIPYDWGKQLPLAAAEDLVETMNVNDSVVNQLILPEEVKLPIHKGDKIGLVEVYEEGRLLGSSYLLATEEVPEPGYGQRISYYMHSTYNFVLSAVN